MAKEGQSMTTEICTAPSPADEPKNESQRDAGRNRDDAHSNRSERSEIPSCEDCLQAIAALPGLVAMRFLTSAQANSIRATYVAILHYHDRNRQGHSAQLADDDVLKLWRDQPQLIDLLQPFLTQAQLDLLMREARDDDRKA
jgi:hypothetical protein